jgi:hypothetical protein
VSNRFVVQIGGTMSKEHPEYIAFLLRMWRVPEDGGAHWRASLERPGDGQQLAFTDLEAAFDYLRRQAGQPPSVPPAADHPRPVE